MLAPKMLTTHHPQPCCLPCCSRLQFCRTSNEMAEKGRSWKFDVDSRHLLTLNGMAFDPTETSQFTVDGRAIPCNVL